MKKQKIKKILRKNIFFVMISFFIVWTVFWAFTSFLISSQYSTDLWSNNSVISFTWTVWNEWYYVNEENNSTVIWNYFKWYYYDSLFWFFKLDWSSNTEENVKVASSTSLCDGGYWYKLSWKAYSEISWYIDFSYNSTTFVYYCLGDWLLHWTAYWKYIWFQNFDWIQVSLVADVESLIEKVNNDTIFINDTTNIETSTTITGEEIETIWWDLIQIDEKRESIFYIIK